jgi:ATP-dependent helicase/nuclease subunit A
LTVHGAKGLEAPVVFLPDTMQLPNRPDTLHGRARAAAVVSARRSAVPFIRENGRYAAQPEEYRRLLLK